VAFVDWQHSGLVADIAQWNLTARNQTVQQIVAGRPLAALLIHQMRSRVS
jgi:hypothetical protein